jgi:hypothetical protein
MTRKKVVLYGTLCHDADGPRDPDASGPWYFHGDPSRIGNSMAKVGRGPVRLTMTPIGNPKRRAKR